MDHYLTSTMLPSRADLCPVTGSGMGISMGWGALYKRQDAAKRPSSAYKTQRILPLLNTSHPASLCLSTVFVSTPSRPTQSG